MGREGCWPWTFLQQSSLYFWRTEPVSSCMSVNVSWRTYAVLPKSCGVWKLSSELIWNFLSNWKNLQQSYMVCWRRSTRMIVCHVHKLLSGIKGSPRIRKRWKTTRVWVDQAQPMKTLKKWNKSFGTINVWASKW